jgi:hypothetical protein
LPRSTTPRRRLSNSAPGAGRTSVERILPTPAERGVLLQLHLLPARYGLRVRSLAPTMLQAQDWRCRVVARLCPRRP